MLTLPIPEIPGELLRLHTPPRQLFTTGADLSDLLRRPRIAIVGSRKITPYGRGVTQHLVRELVQGGVVIVSGLALGADSVAHAACVEAGGQTIAVLPTSLDQIYPTAHTGLATQILATGGMLASEYKDPGAPQKYQFLARNRIIAALSDAVLIPEAAGRSGSLNTAANALELNIPLLAVPGNITSPLSEGTNNLIKAGATPITSVEDIYNTLGWQRAEREEQEVIARTPEEHTILSLIKQGTSDGTQLLQDSGLSAARFNQTLTMLELTGRIRPTGGNYWALA
jgi:DNA processing protein